MATTPNALRIGIPDGSGGKTVQTIPLYDLGDLDTPALRIGVPDGNGGKTVKAMRLADPTDTAARALRIGTPVGVRAIATETAEMLETFEHGEWPHYWSDETEAFALTTTALRGQYSLELTSATFPQVVNANISTPRGHAYSMLIDMRGTSTRPGLMVHTDRSTVAFSQGSFYMAHLLADLSELRLSKYTNGSQTTLASASVDVNTHTEYRLGLRSFSNGLEAVLKDSGGSELAVTPWRTDTAHWGGYLGIYMGGNDPVGTRVDDLRQHALGTF